MLPYRQGAISEWRELVLESDRMSIVLDCISNFADRYAILPCKRDIFNMFRILHPGEVKVVIVAQSPYPGCCPVTNVQYACGPALLPAPGCVTTPATLRKVVLEACRDLSKNTSLSPKDLLLHWISQGVMLLNASLTLGKDCPEYLEDHSVVWEEVMRDILCTISNLPSDPIFLLVGKDAWKFETSLSTNRVIKVSHPVARKDTATPWNGSGVFSRISSMMVEKGELPIRWII